MKARIARSGLGFTFSLLISALFSSPAQAQIEEVVVTAQKRPEDIQDVPISISTFSGDFLKSSQIDTLQQLGNYTPNLTLTQSSKVANQRIIMRGVGSVGDSGIEPSVAVFIDGVYYPRPASVVGSMSDLEMVEVLRGPQGTLFGRNASMGALNIRTAKPSEEFHGEIRGSFGDYGARRVSGFVNGGLVDRTAGRLSFHYSDRDGYGRNTFTSGGSRAEVGAWEDYGVRGKLNFLPNDNLDVTVSVDYARVNNEGQVIEVLSDSVLSPQYNTIIGLVLDPNAIPGVVPPGVFGIGPLPELSDDTDYVINQDHQDDAEDEQWGISADISWDIGEHTVRSITAYRSWENDTFESVIRLPANLINRVTAFDTDTVSQEFQLLSPTGGFLEYVAGFYYYDESYQISQDFDLGPDFCQAAGNAAFLRTFNATGSVAAGLAASGATFPACAFGAQSKAVDSGFEQDVTSLAVYGQASFNITDQFRLTGGLRWTDDDKNGGFFQVVNNIALSPAVLDLRINEGPSDLDFSDDELTWLVNGSYYATDDIMLFASYSTGYKSGGFNSDGFNSAGILRGASRIFDSETVDNYEFGVKSAWFDNKVTANLTVFRTDINNFQDRQFDGVNFIVQNVGELRQQGVELDMHARPIDQFFAVLGMSYLDSEFQKFPNATALPAVVAVSQALGVAPLPRDLKGERNHFSPEWQFSLVGEWEDVLPTTNVNWFVRGEYQFIDDQNVGAETNQNPQTIQEGYDLVNARFGLRGPADKWEVSLFVRNATDEAYCQTMINQPIGTTLFLVDPVTLGGMQRCMLGPPRIWGIEAALTF
jgi:iron complex outermembrane receptor protein